MSRRGLGDYTEKVLKSIGITEDKYKEAKKLFGMAPTCGCRKRKEWLNKVGKHFGIGSEKKVTERKSREERHKDREERRKARQQRAERRAERRDERARRQAAKDLLESTMPPLAEIPPNTDPLQVVDRNRKPCTAMRDQWRIPGSAFLVCGGPSLNTVAGKIEDLRHALTRRGVLSLAINNAAGHVHTTAVTFSDSSYKWHFGYMLDPTVIKFVPSSRLVKKQVDNRVRAKVDGEFRYTAYNICDCPSVFGYERHAVFDPPKFLTDPQASWGHGKKGQKTDSERPKNIFTFFLGIRLLHYLGVRRIYMLGVDFNMQDKQKYAWKEEGNPGTVEGNRDHYRLAQTMCEELRPYLEKGGLQVFQCNPQSHLTAFDYIPFKTALEDCKGMIPSEPFDLDKWYKELPKTLNM